MHNILIIGANRGLGLEFAKQYSDENHNVFATTRNKSESKALNAISKIKVFELDLNSDESLDNFVQQISSQINFIRKFSSYFSYTVLFILINCCSLKNKENTQSKLEFKKTI